MRIGQLTDVYRPVYNGVTNSVYLHKQVLESWGHSVFVFTLGHGDYPDDDPSVVRSLGIPISELGYHFSPCFSRKAIQEMRTMDVLHAHHPFLSARQAVSVGLRYGIPVVFTNHTRYHVQARYYAPFVPPRLSRALVVAFLTRLTARCDLVIVPSKGTRQALGDLGISCPMDVIPNGVDLSQFQHPAAPLSRCDLGLPDQATVAVTVGRLGPEKNLSLLLCAFALVASQKDSVPAKNPWNSTGSPQTEGRRTGRSSTRFRRAYTSHRPRRQAHTSWPDSSA